MGWIFFSGEPPATAMDLFRRERDFLRVSSQILKVDVITHRRSCSSERTVAVRKFPCTYGFNVLLRSGRIGRIFLPGVLHGEPTGNSRIFDHRENRREGTAH